MVISGSEVLDASREVVKAEWVVVICPVLGRCEEDNMGNDVTVTDVGNKVGAADGIAERPTLGGAEGIGTGEFDGLSVSSNRSSLS